jgi:deoxyinosine 3'endonuclease (endonuclease V)
MRTGTSVSATLLMRWDHASMFEQDLNMSLIAGNYVPGVLTNKLYDFGIVL